MNSNTILDFISTNFYYIINQDEIAKEIVLQKNLKSDMFVDYKYNLEPLESGIFNRLKLRFFSEKKDLSNEIPCNATFYSTEKLPTLIIEKLFETIIAKFGIDSCSRFKLDEFDKEDINTGAYFGGRFYQFNNFNNSYQEGDESLYCLLVGIDDEKGLELNILDLQNVLHFVERNSRS